MPFILDFFYFIESALPDFFLFVESALETRVAEATSTAEALQKSLDAEASDRSALAAVVASACEGLGAPVSGSSLRSRVEALYSRAGEMVKEAFHTGVKRGLAVVCSHYAGINLPAVCEGYVLPEDDEEARKERQEFDDAAAVPGDALAALLDDEVELPPLGAQASGQAGPSAP